jgi:hypothetical protein
MSKKASFLKKLLKNIYKRRWLLWLVDYFKSLLVWIAYLLSFYS